MVGSQVPIPINGFLGLYKRGDPTMIPPRHQKELDNYLFINDRLVKRPGFRTLEDINREYVRFFDYHLRSGLQRIYFDGTNFYANSTRLAGDFSSAEDFTALNMNNRFYIAPDVGAVQVYNGSSIRPICGQGPPEDNLNYDNTSFFYPELVASGDATTDPFVPFNYLDVGKYLIAVSYTIGTYITKPGYIRQFEVTDTDTNQLKLVNLPTNIPTNVTGIVLSMTRLIVSDSMTEDQRYQNHPFFFVPFGRYNVSGGVIQSNAGGALTELNFPAGISAAEQADIVTNKYIFFVDQLIFDASYLQDQIESFTDATGLTEYNDKMVVWKGDRIYVSRQDDPESLGNYLRVGIEEAGDIKSCFTLRDILYICKEYSTYAVTDNGDTVDTWNPVVIDRGLGASIYGIGTLRGFGGPTEDFVLVANRQGLCLFNGTFANIEASWKIKELWDTITEIDRTQVLVDTRNKLVHVLVYTTQYELWTMNYQKGFQHEEHDNYGRKYVSGGPRWSRITLGLGTVRAISLDEENRLVVLVTQSGQSSLRYIRTDRISDDDFVDSQETIEHHFTNNNAQSIQDFIDRDWRIIDPVNTRNIAARMEISNVRPKNDLQIYRYTEIYVRCKGTATLRIFDIHDENTFQHRVPLNYKVLRQRLLSQGEDLEFCVCHQNQGELEVSEIIVWASRLATPQ